MCCTVNFSKRRSFSNLLRNSLSRGQSTRLENLSYDKCNVVLTSAMTRTWRSTKFFFARFDLSKSSRWKSRNETWAFPFRSGISHSASLFSLFLSNARTYLYLVWCNNFWGFRAARTNLTSETCKDVSCGENACRFAERYSKNNSVTVSRM